MIKYNFLSTNAQKTKLPGDQKIVVFLNMYYTKYKNTCDLSQTFNCAGKQSSLRKVYTFAMIMAVRFKYFQT